MTHFPAFELLNKLKFKIRNPFHKFGKQYEEMLFYSALGKKKLKLVF